MSKECWKTNTRAAGRSSRPFSPRRKATPKAPSMSAGNSIKKRVRLSLPCPARREESRQPAYLRKGTAGTSEIDRRARKMPEGDKGVQETHGLSAKAFEKTESGRWSSRICCPIISFRQVPLPPFPLSFFSPHPPSPQPHFQILKI